MDVGLELLVGPRQDGQQRLDAAEPVSRVSGESVSRSQNGRHCGEPRVRVFASAGGGGPVPPTDDRGTYERQPTIVFEQSPTAVRHHDHVRRSGQSGLARRHAALLRLHPGASGLRLRSATAVRQHRTTGKIPLVAAGLRAPPEERECPQGQGHGGLSSRKLQGTVPHLGKPQLLAGLPPKVTGPVAQGPLYRGRAVTRTALGRRGQVPHQAEIPAAQDYLGR